MNRTSLITVASHIKKRPIESFNDDNYYGTVYVGLYDNEPMRCFYDNQGFLIAICYKRVMYCICAVGHAGAMALRNFYLANHCHTKVMLYRNYMNLLFVDQEGEYTGYNACKEASRRDYIDCIPIPIVV